MKKALIATTALVAFAGAASAQGLSVTGFLEFEALYGDGYDYQAGQPALSGGDSIDELDFRTDARLNFDWSNSTKSGLEYGMHFELDMDKTDGSDNFGASGIAYNDGYVFINSALGKVSMGDAGNADRSANGMSSHVPYTSGVARDITLMYGEGSYGPTTENNNGVPGNYTVGTPGESELIRYDNSFLGVDFSASTDDDANWTLGLGYSADVGGMNVQLGMGAMAEALSGSVNVSMGGVSAGVSYSGEEYGNTSEYIAAGFGWELGGLSMGAGVETSIFHHAVSGETYVSDYFMGASYEMAPGLLLAAGIANIDNDNPNNLSKVGDDNLTKIVDDYDRNWVGGVSVTVAF